MVRVRIAVAGIIILARCQVIIPITAMLYAPIRTDLGQVNLPFQVLIGVSDLASGFISFFLAVLLFWRKPNDRMALFVSFFLLLTVPPSGISLDYFLTTYLGAPSVYSLASTLSTPLWILILCIFPDGRFVPRWMRWVFFVSIAATFSIFAGAQVVLH